MSVIHPRPRPTSEKYCKQGASCKYKAEGRCKFIHLDSDPYASKEDVKVEEEFQFPDGSVRDQKSKNPGLEDDDAKSTKSDSSSKSEKRTQLCNFNLNCKRADCWSKHSTPNGKSPAFTSGS